MDSFKLKVLKALTATLEEITPANNYNHDLSEAVFRGRLLFDDESDPLPMLAINEPPKAPEHPESPEASPQQKTVHELLIQGFVKNDPNNPTDPAYNLMAEVQKRLTEERMRAAGYDILGLGPRISGLILGQGVVRPPDAAVSNNAFFWLPVTLEYAEDLQNPFA